MGYETIILVSIGLPVVLFIGWLAYQSRKYGEVKL